MTKPEELLKEIQDIFRLQYKSGKYDESDLLEVLSDFLARERREAVEGVVKWLELGNLPEDRLKGFYVFIEDCTKAYLKQLESKQGEEQK